MSSVLQFKATLDQILGSVNELKRSSVSAQYGTVLGVSPLQVSLDDNPSSPLNGVPVSLVSGLVVGDRVWVVSFRSRVIVVGQVGGSGVPTGALSAFAGVAAPPGWLLCDGASYAKSEYPVLAAVLGFTGSGTTFTVPDMRGRVPVGVHPSQSGLTTLGAVGGEYTHTLTVAEMPSHQHDHDQARGGNLSYSDGNGVTAYTAAFGSGRVNTGITTGNTGGGQSHNNMQPYRTVNWIIKI